MMKHAVLLVVLIAGLVPGVVFGGDIGDPAPPLEVKEWIKGNPVEIKPGTNIFVVEIWQSSLPACRAVITNLNNLQKSFQSNGVIVVGISDESPDKLKDFVQLYSTPIDYWIAADDNRQTALSYMRPVNERAVPYAFVVGTNGVLLWRGYPSGALEKVLKYVIAGQYNEVRAAKNELANYQMQEYLLLAQRGDFRAKPAGNLLLANRTNDPSLLCDMAYQIATTPHLAIRNFALAGAALDQAEKLETTNKASVMITRAVWLFESGKRDAAMLLATQALASAQSPHVKTNVQYFLRTMEARMALASTNQSGTNQIKVKGAQTPVHPAASTNQINASQSKDSDVKL
jgi:peroxiredoxin